MKSRSILLVADRTAAGPHVLAALRTRTSKGRCDVTLLVPATPAREGLIWEEGEARSAAQRRMEVAVSQLKRSGVAVTAVLGYFSPMESIREELQQHTYDEILISTLPTRVSRWLRQDLPARAAREFDVPVAHIEADDEPQLRRPAYASEGSDPVALSAPRIEALALGSRRGSVK